MGSWEHAAYESEAYKKSLFDTAHKPCKVARNVGDVDAEFAKASKVHEADYYAPLLAHAAMEPPAAVADFKDGKVVIHTCTQNPQAVQDTVAAAVGIDKKNVICNVTLLGGGFGRKSKPDYVAEAAVLSKKIGKPVKVVWSREDDLRFDYYHAVAGMYMKAATDDKGRPQRGCSVACSQALGVCSARRPNTALHSNWAWVGRICLSIFRIIAPKTGLPRTTFALAGCDRWRTFITRLPRTRLSMSWRLLPTATAWNIFWTCWASLAS